MLLLSTFYIIFGFSSQNGEQSGRISQRITEAILEKSNKYNNLEEAEKEIILHKVEFIIRKMAHFSIYTVLAVFVTSALATYPTLSTKLRSVYSILLCTAYASSDELHQYFVPGRSCELRDVFIDACGAVLGILIVTTVIYFYRTKKENS